MYSHEAIEGIGRSRVYERPARNDFPRLLLLIFIFVSGFWRFEASAQVKVTALTQGTTELKSTKDIGRKRWGESTPTYQISKGMYLEANDQLTCESGTVTLELTSSTNSKKTFPCNFDIVVVGDDDANGFVVDLRSGDANVQSSAPTSVSSGQVNMGSPLTEYSVRVHRTEKGPVLEYVVFEGDVTISSELPKVRLLNYPSAKSVPLGRQTKLKTGEKIVFEGNTPLPKKAVEKADIDNAAKVYAQVDTAKARIAETGGNTEQVYADFHRRYSAVFSDPKNPDHRVNLAIAQVNSRNSSDALYQLNKAERVSVTSNKTALALIALTKGAALTQEKRPEEAQEQFQKAWRLDEKVLDDVSMRNYGFNQATRENIKLIKIRTSTEIGATKPDPLLTGWPVPEKSTLMQRRVFDLIQQQRMQEAAEAMGLDSKPDLLRALNSIDAYLQAIIFYELKNTNSANAAAAAALSMTGKDRLLSKDADVASRRILRATTQQ